MSQNSYREDDPAKEISRIINNQKSLLENMPEAVLLINSDKSVEYANKNADKFFQKLLDDDTSDKKVRKHWKSSILNCLPLSASR